MKVSKKRYQIRNIDAENRTVTFVASTGRIDRHGTIVNQDKWDLDNYRKNPIVGYQHEVNYSGDPDNVIGTADVRVEDGELIADITFEPADLNERADKILRKIEFGSLTSVSVGFLPTGKGRFVENDEGIEAYEYGGQELLEISVVNTPSNVDAQLAQRQLEMDELKALHEQDEKRRKMEDDVKRDSPKFNFK